jgi:uncharacterized protein (TIGR04255 family)
MGRKYEKPFLEKVIIRVDLAFPSFDVAMGLPADITKKLLPLFPIIEPREIKSAVLEISPSNAKASQPTTEMHWILFGRDKEKNLLIAPDHFYIEQRRYESYDNLKTEFATVLDVLASAFPAMPISRFGLRYINKIKPDDETEPLDWEGLIRPSLLAIFQVPQEADTVCRAFHNLTLRFNDSMLTMQYGMHNPDFPAAIKQKVFVIDIDASYQGALTVEEVKQSADEFHNRIEAAFEGAILDSLRAMMGVVE